MAYTTINKSSDYFNTKLYTGTGATQSITGVGFQPDMNWCKLRTTAYNHVIVDAVRGVTKVLRPNLTIPEDTYTNAITSFDSDGFTLGADTNGEHNRNGDNIVSWNWKANGAGSSNTDGSVTATLSANSTSGFSISTFTTPGSGTFTVGHGLGVAPKMIIYRPTGSSSWQVGHNSIGWTNFLTLNSANASSANTAFGNTEPTTSYWTGNTANVGANAPCVAYCFAEKIGYSKFGSYTSNNNADGTFVYTGFKPAFLLLKNITTGNTSWELYDNKRTPNNVANLFLRPNTSDADVSSDRLDILSNGFKLRQVGDTNANSDTIIYMAFAEAPLVGSNNVPCTAR